MRDPLIAYGDPYSYVADCPRYPRNSELKENVLSCPDDPFYEFVVIEFRISDRSGWPTQLLPIHKNDHLDYSYHFTSVLHVGGLHVESLGSNDLSEAGSVGTATWQNNTKRKQADIIEGYFFSNKV
jgi:hypothetical protein